jgi:hypothetical protein
LLTPEEADTTVSWIIQMIGWGLDTFSWQLMWLLVVVGVIAAIAVLAAQHQLIASLPLLAFSRC